MQHSKIKRIGKPSKQITTKANAPTNAATNVNNRIEQVEVNGKNVPVRFALRDVVNYLESRGKTLADLSRSLPIMELLDIFWLAVERGMLNKELFVYENADEFWDDLDDDFPAYSRMSEAMVSSLPKEEEETAGAKN